MRSLLAIVLCALATACATGGHAIATARAARYHGDKLALFAAMKATVETAYALARSDETALRIETSARWYTPDGLGGERGNDQRGAPDRRVGLAMIAALVPDGDDWAVTVEPQILRDVAGRAGPGQPAHSDPSDHRTPGWAIEEADRLHTSIHRALQSHAVENPPDFVQPDANRLVPR
jgi:hypothetical protein